jgi:aminoglycoside phosphotransferase (APT) family kinase protein
MGHGPIIAATVRAMPVWTAEVTVDEPLARRLITEQFPELAVAALTLLGEGWDNTVWLVDERWVFRFPRREVAVPGFERELAALPGLAPRLPLPIPNPVFAGRPAEDFPWPFFGAPHVPGREPLGLSEPARVALGRPFGHFLRALHDAPVDADLSHDPMGRADMAIRVPRTLEQLAPVEAAGLWRAPDSVARFLDAAHALPPSDAAVVLHGDLHLRHVLVDDHDAPSGVIDWGDICRGDPSIDLTLFWSMLPPAGRAEFLAAYGPVSEEQLVRARVLAINLCSILLLYAHSEGMPEVEREALAGLERAAAG